MDNQDIPQNYYNQVKEASDAIQNTEESNRTDDEGIIKSAMCGFKFKLTDEGLYWLDKSDDNKIKEVLISRPLQLVAKARDKDSMNWSRVLEFCDDDGEPHRYVLHMADLAMDGREVLGKLMSHGLGIYPSKEARDMLLMYIKDAIPISSQRSRLTDRTGWHDSQFILPDRIIGSGEENYIFESSSTLIQTYSRRGTLDSWRANVAALCRGNSRLAFAVSAAFASAILGLTNDENGGFHFFGGSSTGKTHTLYAAASACGKPSIKDNNSYIHSWRGTSNGQEGIAKLHNDSLLILDEMGESSSKEVGEIAYMLANGAGKQRSHTTGEARKRSNWRCLFLSTGEITLAQHMNEGGRATRAGQEIRLVDIPADANVGLGVYENLHGIEDGRRFSEELKRRCLENYGTAFPAFIEAILRDKEDHVRRLIKYKEKFIQSNLPANAASQVHRVLTRFALVAAAGECATFLGITGWEADMASSAALRCFRDWLNQRESGSGMHETTAILRQVRAFFQRHGDSRFALWTKTPFQQDRVTQNRAGFRRVSGTAYEYFVLTECFKSEICSGHNPKDVSKILVDRGILVPGSDGRSAGVATLPGIGSTRCYHFRPSVMEDHDE